MSERPLHVRVADALGAIPVGFPTLFGLSKTVWKCRCGDCPHVDPDANFEIFHYDEDWAATGPLIERFGIELSPPTGEEDEHDWGATTWGNTPTNARGGTALKAVCRCLLELAKEQPDGVLKIPRAHVATHGR